MPRQVRSDVAALLREARALELLADEAEVGPARLQDYWAMSADLITLVADIERLQATRPDTTYEDPELLMLRRKLREITSRLAEMTME